eukprot:7389127-Prymnesium_polylepis.1
MGEAQGLLLEERVERVARHAHVAELAAVARVERHLISAQVRTREVGGGSRKQSAEERPQVWYRRPVAVARVVDVVHVRIAV